MLAAWPDMHACLTSTPPGAVWEFIGNCCTLAIRVDAPGCRDVAAEMTTAAALGLAAAGESSLTNAACLGLETYGPDAELQPLLLRAVTGMWGLPAVPQLAERQAGDDNPDVAQVRDPQ